MSEYTPKIAPAGSFATNLIFMFGDLARAVGEVNVANGWDTSRGMVADPDAYDPKWQVAHKIAELGLIDTEVSEAIEDVRAGLPMDYLHYTKANTSPYDESQSHNDDGTPRKPEGVPSELADVVIRVLDIADAYGIDLGKAIIQKLNHNATRGQHHGGKAL